MTRRLRACVENWPEAETGAYHPSCCRFPKSCSATVYDDAENDLEALTMGTLRPDVLTADLSVTYEVTEASLPAVELLFDRCLKCQERRRDCTCHERGYN